MQTNKKRLTKGNSKVKAWLFSLPPIKSCLNCKDCKTTCYATKAYKQYPSVRNLWDDNFNLARYNRFHLYADLKAQLKKIEKSNLRVVRIHQSGDFFNQEYINMWTLLAIEFPTVTFYGYSKVFNILDLSRLTNLRNVNIIDSFIDNKLNYGDINHVNDLKENHGAFICPATKKGLGEVKCGVDCSYCFTNNKVAFLIH